MTTASVDAMERPPLNTRKIATLTGWLMVVTFVTSIPAYGARRRWLATAQTDALTNHLWTTSPTATATVHDPCSTVDAYVQRRQAWWSPPRRAGPHPPPSVKRGAANA
jgi:hypothetical protein